jgi:hypothetical protein
VVDHRVFTVKVPPGEDSTGGETFVALMTEGLIAAPVEMAVVAAVTWGVAVVVAGNPAPVAAAACAGGVVLLAAAMKATPVDSAGSAGATSTSPSEIAAR